MEIFEEHKPNYLEAVKASGLYKTAMDFADLLNYISGRIFVTPKFESYEKQRILACHGIDASVFSLKGIIELCSIGDIVDAVMLIRKIRDNLFLDLFLIKCSDDWDESNVSMPDLKELVSNPDLLMEMLNEFNTKQIKYEKSNEYKVAVKKWREGKLLNNADSETKRKFFQFTSYLNYLKRDSCFNICCERYLKPHFDLLDRFLNDFTHSNSPSSLNNHLFIGSQKLFAIFKRISETIETLKYLFIISMYFVDSGYFQSEDYENCIEFNLGNPEGLQYNVIADIVDVFETIRVKNINLYNFLISNNKFCMKIQLEDYAN